MTDHHVTTAILFIAAALFACDVAVGQTQAPSVPAAVPAGTAAANPAALDVGDCPDVATGFELGKTYACSCSESAVPDISMGASPIYGASVYSNDSNICIAALHAGVLKPNAAARILVQMVDSPAVFKGTTQNGVKSQVWATATSAAFQIAPSK